MSFIQKLALILILCVGGSFLTLFLGLVVCRKQYPSLLKRLGILIGHIALSFCIFAPGFFIWPLLLAAIDRGTLGLEYALSNVFEQLGLITVTVTFVALFMASVTGCMAARMQTSSRKITGSMLAAVLCLLSGDVFYYFVPPSDEGSVNIFLFSVLGDIVGGSVAGVLIGLLSIWFSRLTWLPIPPRIVRATIICLGFPAALLAGYLLLFYHVPSPVVLDLQSWTDLRVTFAGTTPLILWGGERAQKSVIIPLAGTSFTMSGFEKEIKFLLEQVDKRISPGKTIQIPTLLAVVPRKFSTEAITKMETGNYSDVLKVGKTYYEGPISQGQIRVSPPYDRVRTQLNKAPDLRSIVVDVPTNQSFRVSQYKTLHRLVLQSSGGFGVEFSRNSEVAMLLSDPGRSSLSFKIELPGKNLNIDTNSGDPIVEGNDRFNIFLLFTPKQRIQVTFNIGVKTLTCDECELLFHRLSTVRIREIVVYGAKGTLTSELKKYDLLGSAELILRGDDLILEGVKDDNIQVNGFGRYVVVNGVLVSNSIWSLLPNELKWPVILGLLAYLSARWLRHWYGKAD